MTGKEDNEEDKKEGVAAGPVSKDQPCKIFMEVISREVS